MDFKNLINQLTSLGMSEYAIAESTGTTQPTINRLKKGLIQDPKYSVGSKLVELHTNVVGGDSKNAA